MNQTLFYLNQQYHQQNRKKSNGSVKSYESLASEKQANLNNNDNHASTNPISFNKKSLKENQKSYRNNTDNNYQRNNNYNNNNNNNNSKSNYNHNQFNKYSNGAHVNNKIDSNQNYNYTKHSKYNNQQYHQSNYYSYQQPSHPQKPVTFYIDDEANVRQEEPEAKRLIVEADTSELKGVKSTKNSETITKELDAGQLSPGQELLEKIFQVKGSTNSSTTTLKSNSNSASSGAFLNSLTESCHDKYSKSNVNKELAHVVRT